MGIREARERFGMTPNRFGNGPLNPTGFGGVQNDFQNNFQNNNQVFIGPAIRLRNGYGSGFGPMAMNQNITNFVLGMNQKMVNMAMNPFAMLNQFQGAINGQRLQRPQIDQSNPRVQQLLAQRGTLMATVKELNARIGQIGEQLGDATRGLAKAQAEMASLNSQDGKKDNLVAVRKLALQSEIQKFQAEVNRLKEQKAQAVQFRQTEQNWIRAVDAQIAQISRQSQPIV